MLGWGSLKLLQTLSMSLAADSKVPPRTHLARHSFLSSAPLVKSRKHMAPVRSEAV